MKRISYFQKEDLSDGENSESMSSVPDSEVGASEALIAASTDTRDKEARSSHERSHERSSHQPVPASGGGLSPSSGPGPQPPPLNRVKQPRGQGLTPPSQPLKPLTSLANLSPTPKSLLTGI